jgi:RNA polymerase sigma-70 factor (ECF subfamily)
LGLLAREDGETDHSGAAVAVDDAEFSEFFASQYGPLCWLGLLLTGSRVEAEELAQEALVRTWWRWKLVRRPADPGSYARRVLVNRHRSLLRRATVEARWLARSRPAEQELVVAAGDERALVLWQAVRALPSRQRAVLVLRFHQDLTEAEVARLLGLPLGTVKSLGHRALARLRQRLGSPSLDPAGSSTKEER